ncbi:MAG TPA: Crp/Fnr family transcriptional regulator [Chloroflexota bacterium]|jgi:CRP/FNR family transcriptional regulator
MHGHAADRMLGEAVEHSFLAALPEDALERLTVGAVRLDVPAGSTLYREGERPSMALLADGLLRVYLTSAHGRQVTIRYARAGSVLGVPLAIAGPVDTSVQALTRVTLFVLNVATVQALGQTDARVAWALAQEVTRRLYEVLDAFTGNAFGSVRQRVARHLLDLAAEHQHDAALVAPVSQQELADAAGTVREVVTRVLREMRDEGLVETSKQGVILSDPASLQRVADLRNE